jgi:hypothetical protein
MVGVEKFVKIGMKIYLRKITNIIKYFKKWKNRKEKVYNLNKN